MVVEDDGGMDFLLLIEHNLDVIERMHARFEVAALLLCC